MRKLFTILSIFISIGLLHAQPLPKVQKGTIERIEKLSSKFVDARNVDVWLPEGYSAKKKYAVLYMHDGQMLFDSTTTWNKKSWDVDKTVSRLIEEGKLQDFIVVGVWNGDKSRHADYFPQKPFESLDAAQKEAVLNSARNNAVSIFGNYKIQSDGYLKFLVQELKPLIDKKYATKKDAAHTFIAGSSMGGLISMYAICEYPTIFGGAACLSTHWPGIFITNNNPIPDAFVAYMKNHLPNPKNHKIYFDYGDKTLDAMYPPLQKKVDELMTEKGFTDKSWMTKFFPGQDHSENSWKDRFEIPLQFLLGK
ncbi:MAG: alpha/beta hydrolase-fold protein [Bacteroidetes bacterium]|nr:alpha/beta hydrolase-fold protein [Bacteroidota bacterium]